MSPVVRVEIGNKLVKHGIIDSPEKFIDWLNDKLSDEEVGRMLIELYKAEHFPDLND